ncbi:MAG: hypothetical protein ACP5E4_04585 [Candidatus Aenigmatarchaeota archaeon]
MLLTFEKIREVQLSERSESLQKLPENFYGDVAEYLKHKEGTDEEKAARRLIEGLIEKRTKKIVNMAILYCSSDRVPENLESTEVALYEALVGAIRKHYGSLAGIVGCRKPAESFGAGRPDPGDTKDGPGDISRPEDGVICVDGGVCFSAEPVNDESGPREQREPGVNPDEKKARPSEPEAQTIEVEFISATPELMLPGVGARSFGGGERIALEKNIADFLEKKGFCKRA